MERRTFGEETPEQEEFRHEITELVVRAFVHNDKDSVTAREELTQMGLDLTGINHTEMLKSQIVTKLLNQLEKNHGK